MDRFLREYGHYLLDELRAGRMSRREFLRWASVVGLSGWAGALFRAPDSLAGPAPRRGGVLRVALVPPTAAVDPVTMYDAGAIAVVQQVAEYLVWTENDLRLRPVLAVRWRPDGTARRWTFTLRRGVWFSDGRPLTADDVVATFDRLTDPQSNSAALSQFRGILSKGNVERVDDRTVVFHLDRPFADFPYLVSSTNYNTVILPKDYGGEFERRPVGTGPFLLDGYLPKQRAVFRRNPRYWAQGRPYLERVEFRFYPEIQPQVLALQAGEVDMMLSTPFVAARALVNRQDIVLLATRSTQHRAVHMRVDRPPFNDRRVRQAIALCLDRMRIVQALFAGQGDLGEDHVFAPVFPGAPSLPRRQDYERAKQLLAQAGHPGGLEITLTAEQYLEVPQYAVLLQEMLKPAGIRAKLDFMTQAAYYGSGSNQPWLEVPMGITDWAARAVPSQFILPAYTCGGIWNSAKWCNERFDRLARQYDATLDPNARRRTARQMAQIQQEETPALIAYWIRALRAVRRTVHGVEADGSEFLDLTRAWIG